MAVRPHLRTSHPAEPPPPPPPSPAGWLAGQSRTKLIRGKNNPFPREGPDAPWLILVLGGRGRRSRRRRCITYLVVVVGMQFVVSSGRRQVADGVGRSDDYQTDESIYRLPHLLETFPPIIYVRPSMRFSLVFRRIVSLE
jgi:hypothetical protein